MILEVIVLIACIIPSFSEVDRRVITSLKYSNYRVKLTVVNGKPAEHSEVPHLVSLKEPTKRKGKMKLWCNLCGASVIANGRILTAAHCFEGNNFFYAKRPYILRAISGSPKTDIESEGMSGISKDGVQWRQLTKAVLHSQFVFPNNDIAIAFLDAPFDYKNGVTPIPLATTNTDWLGDCYVAGYGRTGHSVGDPTSAFLLLAKIDTMSRYMCSKLWEMRMDGFICTTSRSGDAGEGDSGGPLWCERDPPGAPAGSALRELAGVVSGKNHDKTTLFTRVSAYVDWIRSDGKFNEYKNEATKAFALYFRMILLALFGYIIGY